VAREVILKTWCDPCLDNERHVEGTELAPLLLPELPGRQAVTLALCEVCRKEIYDPLVEALREYGQHVDEHGNPSGPRGKYKKAGSDGEPLTCPAAGCGHQSPNRPALASHARGQHDATLGELEGLETPFECPECERRFTRKQGMAAHRARVHSVPGEDSHPNRAKAS